MKKQELKGILSEERDKQIYNHLVHILNTSKLPFEEVEKIIRKYNNSKNWNFEKVKVLKEILQTLNYDEDIFLSQVNKKIEEKDTQPIENVISLKKLLEMGVPKIEWRVENIVVKSGITFLAGTAGSMKSWGGMQMAIACATGTDWLNQYPTEKCNVLYIDEENGNITVPVRFNQLVNGHNLNEKDLSNINISIFNNIQLDTEEGLHQLGEYIEKLEPKLVIIDSMVRCMEGEEDKSSDVKMVFSNLKVFMEQGISFVILHHTAKRETYNMQGLRGSGDFAAFADSVLMFKSGKEGYCNVKAVKNRHIAIEDLNEFFFALEAEDEETIKLDWKGLCDSEGNVIERCIEAIKNEISIQNITKLEPKALYKMSEEENFSKNTIFSAIKSMCDSKLLTKLKRGTYLVEEGSIPRVTQETIDS